LLRYLDRECAIAQATKGRLALLLVELRRVDRLQALLKGPAADVTMALVLERLRPVLRAEDRMAAISDEQVCLVLPRIAHPTQAVLAAVKCLRALDRPIAHEGSSAVLRPCVGIASIPEHSADPAQLLMAADVARRIAGSREEGYHVFQSEDNVEADVYHGLDIMAAQFFSALADNALLVVAIFVLKDALAPDWQIPLLKLFFTISYVALAAFVGALADSMAKRRVMLIGNGIKVVGCALMFAHVHPLLAYAVVGLGAASYSPAKYGILTEYLPHRLLVVANGWIEGLTVGAIILGVLMGGLLIDPSLSARLLAIDLPMIDTGLDTTVEISLAIVGSLYLLAGFFNLFIPDTGVPLKPLHSSPLALWPISATASPGSGRTSSGRFHSPSPRFSGAPARRCSSS
jgi:GGDEF domain-containing protein